MAASIRSSTGSSTPSVESDIPCLTHVSGFLLRTCPAKEYKGIDSLSAEAGHIWNKTKPDFHGVCENETVKLLNPAHNHNWL